MAHLYLTPDSKPNYSHHSPRNKIPQPNFFTKPHQKTTCQKRIESVNEWMTKSEHMHEREMARRTRYAVRYEEEKVQGGMAVALLWAVSTVHDDGFFVSDTPLFQIACTATDILALETGDAVKILAADIRARDMAIALQEERLWGYILPEEFMTLRMLWEEAQEMVKREFVICVNESDVEYEHRIITFLDDIQKMCYRSGYGAGSRERGSG